MRLRASVRGPPWWRALSSWSRVSLAGLAAAALLAIALGIYIPRQVEHHMLAAQTESHRQVLGGLFAAEALPGDESFDAAMLHRFVQLSILRGDIVRAKLWSPSGTILYSDDPAIVGVTFAPSPALRGAISGEAISEISNLDEPENRQERGLASKLLEFYLPIERDGRVVAVWEVYQSLDTFEARLGRVRLAVWMSVGTGLAILAVFLVSSFASLLVAVQRRREEAERRSRQLATILEVSRTVGASLDALRLAHDAVDAIRGAGDFEGVALVRHRGEGESNEIVAAAARPDCPAACALSAAPGVMRHEQGCASLGIALGERAGDLTLVACKRTPGPFAAEEQTFLKAAGEEIRIGLENAHLYAEQRRLLRLLVSAHDDERRHIVGEIHDGIAQDLHRVLYGLRGSQGARADEVAEELKRLEALTDQSIRRLRRLLHRLRPSTLEAVGFVASLRGLVDGARRAGLHVEIIGSETVTPEPSPPVREAAYGIVQEALRNVQRHARAAQARVELALRNGRLSMRIIDDGRGISDQPEGLGLWLMRERAEALGGSFEIVSGQDGTAVHAEIPIGGTP